jgi:hypothetical protein
MDVELGALVLADLTPGIDGFLLHIEVAAAMGRSIFLTSQQPSALGTT